MERPLTGARTGKLGMVRAEREANTLSLDSIPHFIIIIKELKAKGYLEHLFKIT